MQEYFSRKSVSVFPRFSVVFGDEEGSRDPRVSVRGQEGLVADHIESGHIVDALVWQDLLQVLCDAMGTVPAVEHVVVVAESGDLLDVVFPEDGVEILEDTRADDGVRVGGRGPCSFMQ